ncbi:MAG: VWA domain-containing protein, partial [Proteobacteria bacterium]|nr:VWA domain-containing protein [Pseudomonadota bacterium]
FLDDVAIGMVGDSTAIGDAIGVASNRFMSVEAPSKVMVLLTDGDNSAGTIMPKQAAEAAKGLGIKIYTIGVAGSGVRMRGFFQRTQSVDRHLLEYIAHTTGGQFFMADSTKSLQEIYQTIDQLETREAAENVRHLNDDFFDRFLFASLGAFLCFYLLGILWWRRWP